MLFLLNLCRKTIKNERFGTYQESCPLGVLELRTSMQLTSICALGSSWSWNVRHLIVVYSGG